MPDPPRLVGDIAAQASPVGMLSDRFTVPLNRFSAVIVIVEVADWFTSSAAGVVADVAKSRNWKRAVEECTREPLVPVTMRV